MKRIFFEFKSSELHIVFNLLVSCAETIEEDISNGLLLEYKITPLLIAYDVQRNTQLGIYEH